jgi:four helix bundle protein
MFDFEKLLVYNKAKVFNKEILLLIRSRKNVDSYIRDQIRRASISAVINIAEGSGKFSKADKRNFYTIARGSIYECVSLLELIKEDGLIDSKEFDYLYSKCDELSKMLLGLINSQR